MPQPKYTRATVNDFEHYPVPYVVVLVDVVLILHVSLTNKITVTLFTLILTYYSLAGEKS